MAVLAQVRQDLYGIAQFTTGGSGTGSLTIKAQVYRFRTDGATVDRVVTDGTPVEVGLGFYAYKCAGSVVDRPGLYIIVFTEAGSTQDNDEVEGGRFYVGEETHLASTEPEVRVPRIRHYPSV